MIFVNLKDSTPPAQVSDIWYLVRKKKVGDIRNTLPQGVAGVGFNVRVRRHLRASSTASPPTDSPTGS